VKVENPGCIVTPAGVKVENSGCTAMPAGVKVKNSSLPGLKLARPTLPDIFPARYTTNLYSW
jgi:hypothetical protein